MNPQTRAAIQIDLETRYRIRDERRALIARLSALRRLAVTLSTKAIAKRNGVAPTNVRTIERTARQPKG